MMSAILLLSLAVPQDPVPTTGDKPFLVRMMDESHIEVGALYTIFDGDLSIANFFSFYGRVSLAVYEHWYAAFEFRYTAGSNDEEVPDEDLVLRSWLVGASYRWPAIPDIDVVFTAEGGIANFRSNKVAGDNAFEAALQAATHWRLTEPIRIKVGIGVDFISTDFRQAGDRRWVVDFSGSLGVDIGF